MWVCYFTTNWFVILRDVCELYTWNLVNRMLCVAFWEHVKLSYRLESPCSSIILRLCARISKLSKIVYARGFETRNFSSIRHFNVRFSIAQRMALGSILRSHFAPFQWSHVSNCCAEVRFPSTKQRAFYLRSSLLLKRKQEYVRNLSRFCSHIFHAIRLIAQIFSPPTWFLFYNFFVIH